MKISSVFCLASGCWLYCSRSRFVLVPKLSSHFSRFKTISYPESSGFLVSGATPGRLWGHRILLPQDFCGKTMATVTEQPIKKIEFFRCPQSLPGVAPLTKKPEDSGYEIGFKKTNAFEVASLADALLARHEIISPQLAGRRCLRSLFTFCSPSPSPTSPISPSTPSPVFFTSLLLCLFSVDLVSVGNKHGRSS